MAYWKDEETGIGHFVRWSEDLEAELKVNDLRRECDHASSRLVVAQIKGGQQYRNACNTCGALWGNALSKAQVQGKAVGVYDPAFHQHLINEVEKERTAIWRKHIAIQYGEKEQSRQYYNQYLASDQWRSKRDAVLIRDNYICQGCGGDATEVHHTTYDHIYDEFLFELISVCSACHRRIHGKDDELQEAAE